MADVAAAWSVPWLPWPGEPAPDPGLGGPDGGVRARARVGPGVMVLGMYRSGTSATARVLNLLGLAVCPEEDRLLDYRQRAVWESKSLGAFCERLFIHLGGHWFAPPTLEPGWEWRPELAAWRDEAAVRFVAVHPASPWVWKDPQACVLLPFWDAALGLQPVRVMSVRRPDEVASSLFEHGKTPRRLGFALWERHVRDALVACAGGSALICLYDELVAHPRRWCERAVPFLAAHDIRVADPMPAEVVEFVQGDLRHHTATSDLADDAQITPEQVELWRWACEHRGAWNELDVGDLPPESPSTEQMIDGARFSSRFRRPASPESDAARRRRGMRARRAPSVRVVVRGPGALSPTAAARLEDELPARLAVDAEGDADVVVFCDAGSVPEPGWLEPLLAALDDPDTGIVAPALRPLEDSDGEAPPVAGFMWGGPRLARRWLPVRRDNSDAVAFVPTLLAAMRADTLAAVNFDPAFLTAAATDAELCLRLWRMGLQCRVAPAAHVRHRDAGPDPVPVDPYDALHDAVRIGLVHFNAGRLARMLERLGAADGFSAAMADAFAGDSALRRHDIESRCPHGDDWFFRRFPFDPYPQENDKETS